MDSPRGAAPCLQTGRGSKIFVWGNALRPQNRRITEEILRSKISYASFQEMRPRKVAINMGGDLASARGWEIVGVPHLPRERATRTADQSNGERDGEQAAQRESDSTRYEVGPGFELAIRAAL